MVITAAVGIKFLNYSCSEMHSLLLTTLLFLSPTDSSFMLLCFVKFRVLNAANMKTTPFRNVALCGLV
jgi:hypothetical protein